MHAQSRIEYMLIAIAIKNRKCTRDSVYTPCQNRNPQFASLSPNGFGYLKLRALELMVVIRNYSIDWTVVITDRPASICFSTSGCSHKNERGMEGSPAIPESNSGT